MSRYFLQFSYDGSQYHGWQIQPNAHTVQAELEQAISTILRTETNLVAAGRTDTGVHAKKMFAHFDNQLVNTDQLLYKLNALLPKDIAVQACMEVKAEAHARFDATSRAYEYHIIKSKDPFSVNRAWHCMPIPKVDWMNEACQHLIGKQDFSVFSKSNTQTFTNDCEIYSAEWQETSAGMVFHIRANRFLRNMVRAIVGTLVEVGWGKRQASEIKELIASKNRSLAGTSVPAHGLYLTDIEYPQEVFI